MKNFLWGVLFLFITCPVWSFTLTTTNSNMEGWSDRPLTVLYNSGSCPIDVSGYIDSSLELWNNVATSGFKMERGADTTLTPTGCDFAGAVIYCSGSLSGSTIGVGSTSCFSGNRVTGGYVQLNISGSEGDIRNLTALTVEAAIAHEIGHMIGFGHSEDPNALMYFSEGPSRVAVSLGQDDIDAMTYLYPRNELGGDGLMGCALVSAANKPFPPEGGALLAIPLLVWFFLRKRWLAYAA